MGVWVVDLDLPAIEKILIQMGAFRPKRIDAPVRFSSAPQGEGTPEARQVSNIETICRGIIPEAPIRWLKELKEDGVTMKHESAFNYRRGSAPIFDQENAIGPYIKAASAGGLFDRGGRGPRVGSC